MTCNGYTVQHIGRSTRQDGPDWTPKESDEMTKRPRPVAFIEPRVLEGLTFGGSGCFDISAPRWAADKGLTAPLYSADEMDALTAERDALAARVKALETPAEAARVLLDMHDAPFIAARVAVNLSDKKAVGFLRAIAEGEAS